MELWQHGVFVLCVLVATFAQNTTGFAFGLLLLGLTGMLQIAPMSAVANVSTILTMVNALLLVRAWPQLQRGLLFLILAASLCGVALGVYLLGWLSGEFQSMLRMLLGSTIVLCSLMLLLTPKPHERLSGTASFMGMAGLSGVMGGLFASAGPPMVFHLYRQPLPIEVVRQTLILLFAVNALLRLGLVAGQGGFDHQTMLLTLEALPVVLLFTTWMKRRPLRIAQKHMRVLVFVLLMLSGMSLLWQSLLSLIE